MKSKTFVYFLALFTLVGWSGCNNSKDPDSSADFDRAGMLINYADNLIVPRFEKLAVSAELLHSAAVDFSQGPNMEKLTALRNQLKSTRMVYQSCTTYDFGPAKDHAFRFILNTYPVNTGTIEGNISSGIYDLNTIENMTANGLPALEFLLFGNQKTDQEILDQFTSDSGFENRQKYLVDVAIQVNTVSQLVKNEWVNGYAQVFKNSTGTSTGSSVSLLLNAIVLDFERYIRDGKIGIPLGVRSLGVAKPETVEAYYNDYSLDLFEESISQFSLTFNGISEDGTNGLGLDDYLKNKGGTEIANSVQSQLNQISVKSDMLTGALSDEVVSNKLGVEQLYAELQKTIILLKVEMPSALSILITYQDTDGD